MKILVRTKAGATHYGELHDAKPEYISLWEDDYSSPVEHQIEDIEYATECVGASCRTVVVNGKVLTGE